MNENENIRAMSKVLPSMDTDDLLTVHACITAELIRRGSLRPDASSRVARVIAECVISENQ